MLTRSTHRTTGPLQSLESDMDLPKKSAATLPTEDQIRAGLAEIDSWYHVIELGHGIVTPGAFDMRKYLHHYPIPEDMSGMRVLDVGASNGYFALEFAKRGAAEVIALDLPGWEDHDWSPRQRRVLADRPADESERVDHSIFSGALDLSIRANEFVDVIRPQALTIYQISPERLGMFDFVFSGSMLMHVRDPLAALHAIRTVVNPGGTFMVSVSTIREEDPEPIAAFVGEWDQSNFWQMNPVCFKRMLTTADFEQIQDEVLYDQRADIADFTDRIFACTAKPRRG